MNVKHKIQAAAAVVILNGAAALGVTDPSIARASSCPARVIPFSYNFCLSLTQTQRNNACAESGCTLLSATCVNYPLPPGPGLLCQYD
jgi:hypothetical protein